MVWTFCKNYHDYSSVCSVYVEDSLQFIREGNGKRNIEKSIEEEMMNRSLTEKLKIYETLRIPYFSGFWYRFMSKIEMRSIEKEQITEYPLNQEDREEVITVSLTSFPARIEYTHYAIKTLMLQTYKPDRIVLWLAEEQFPKKNLPEQLLELKKYGLEIKWTKDYSSYKKFIHVVEEQKKNELVITFDDDILYPPKCIERLIKKHKEYPSCLICERAQAINYAEDKLYNPGKWDIISKIGIKEPSYSLCHSSGGGCLIPYGAFYQDAAIEEKFTKLASKNDDIWYMFMCVQNDTKIIKTRKYHKIFTVVTGSQVVQLATENVQQNKSVEIMHKLIEAYPKAWERILGEGK